MTALSTAAPVSLIFSTFFKMSALEARDAGCGCDCLKLPASFFHEDSTA